MEKRNYIVVFDLGTSNIVIAVGVKTEDAIEVLGVVSKPVKGVVAGTIDNIADVSLAIKEAITEIEDMVGIRIIEAYAGISGDFVRCTQHTDHVFVDDHQNGVVQKDVDMLFDRMRNVQAPDNEVIMARMPQNYIVDDKKEVTSPIGSFGKKLSSTFNFILCHKTPIERLNTVLKRLGIGVIEIFPNSIVIPESLLSLDEKEDGVAVVNVGGGLTDVTVYYHNVVRYVATIPIGGVAINRDIRSIGIPEKHVEKLKTKYGCAVVDLVDEKKFVKIPGRTPKEAKNLSLSNLSAIIEPRAINIVDYVMQEIESSKYGDKLACGIVLTGGSAHLSEFDKLFQSISNMDVRLAAPEIGVAEVSKELVDNTSYTTAIGLLLRGASVRPCLVDERPIKVTPPQPQVTPPQQPQQPRPQVQQPSQSQQQQPSPKIDSVKKASEIVADIPKHIVDSSQTPSKDAVPIETRDEESSKADNHDHNENQQDVVNTVSSPILDKVDNNVSAPNSQTNKPPRWVATMLHGMASKINKSFSAADDEEI